jgi:hypothetical protein
MSASRSWNLPVIRPKAQMITIVPTTTKAVMKDAFLTSS